MRVTTGVVLWLAAAAAATAVGLFAVGAIGTDIFGASAGDPLSQSEVDAQLAESARDDHRRPAVDDPAAVVDNAGPRRPRPRRRPRKTVSVRSAGGTVWARCAPGGVEVVGSAPAQGYHVDSENEGIDDHPHVRFRSDSGRAEVEVRLRCAGGTIQPEIRDK